MRIKNKKDEIREYIIDLEKIMPSGYEEYASDIKTKAACERYFEKIIEAVVDLAFLIIKYKGYTVPEEDKGAFDILVKEEMISFELSEKLKDAKGMRNIIAHEYGKVDNELVFHSITQELITDVSEFLEKITDFY